ncbi:hypothetical protein AGMMS49944_10760 [Spirochaetia bacterium]|nr:hypothetical protein AGMMS49944_10760 [Spirochaetia bacterium]
MNAGVKKFFDEIAKVDRKVEESASAKRGSGLSKFGIVLLTVYGLGFGIVFGITEDMSSFNVPWLMILLSLFCIFLILLLRKPRWVKEDQEKQALVDNLIVPNEKESIAEFFLFASTNIVKVNPAKSLLSVSARYDQKWNAIWSRKCKQIYTKASMALSDDTVLIKQLDSMLNEIAVTTNKQNKALAAIAGVMAVVIIAALFVVIDPLGKVPATQTISTAEITVNGPLASYINIADGEYVLRSNTSGSSKNLSITVPVELIKDFAPVVDKQVTQILTDKQWNTKDTSINKDVYLRVKLFNQAGVEVTPLTKVSKPLLAREVSEVPLKDNSFRSAQSDKTLLSLLEGGKVGDKATIEIVFDCNDLMKKAVLKKAMTASGFEITANAWYSVYKAGGFFSSEGLVIIETF